MENRNIDILKDGLKKLNIELNDKQYNMFIKYYDILIEKNKVMNLTTITEFNEVMIKHFIDSLSIVKVYNLNNDNISILDVGTGAGFPGIPIKIAFPKINIVLLDSLNKRIKYLNDVIQYLNLKNIVAIHGRAEDFARDKIYREQFDLVVSRAVANLSTLSEYCLPYVNCGGKFISYKSKDIDEEILASKSAIHLLGGKLSHIESFYLPNTNIQRSLVIIDKIEKTSNKYPRLAGKPSKEPL